MSRSPSISIIIPVYRESERINALIDDLRRLDTVGEVEIIVVDGDPERSTLGAIDDPAVVALGSIKGRAKQMNAGAAVARGETLLFLHADTLLPSCAFERITSVMKDTRYVGGAFGVTFDSDRRFLRLLGHIASMRPRITRVPYGDNAIFVRRAYFHRLGGYSDIPIMEDIELMKRVRSARGRICIVGDRVLTSARRFEEKGLVRGVFRGAALLVLYALGVSPYRLKPHYGDEYRPESTKTGHPTTTSGK